MDHHTICQVSIPTGCSGVQNLGTSLLQWELFSLRQVIHKWLPRNLGWPGKMCFSCYDKRQKIKRIMCALVCNIFVASKVYWVELSLWSRSTKEMSQIVSQKCLCSIKFRDFGIHNWIQPFILQKITLKIVGWAAWPDLSCLDIFLCVVWSYLTSLGRRGLTLQWHMSYTMMSIAGSHCFTMFAPAKGHSLQLSES